MLKQQPHGWSCMWYNDFAARIVWTYWLGVHPSQKQWCALNQVSFRWCPTFRPWDHKFTVYICINISSGILVEFRSWCRWWFTFVLLKTIQDLEVGVAWPNPKVLASKHETFEDGLTSNSKFGGCGTKLNNHLNNSYHPQIRNFWHIQCLLEKLTPIFWIHGLTFLDVIWFLFSKKFFDSLSDLDSESIVFFWGGLHAALFWIQSNSRFFVWFTKRYSPIFRDVESDNGCMPVFLLGVSVGQVGGIKSHGELVSIFCDENRPWIFSEDIRCIITSQLPNPTFYMICYLPGVCDEPGKTKSCCLDSLFLTFFVVDVLWVSLFVQNSSKNETKAAKYYQKLNASQKNFLGVDKKAS